MFICSVAICVCAVFFLTSYCFLLCLSFMLLCRSLALSFGSKIILSFLALLPKMSNPFQQQLLHEKCQQTYTHTLYTTHIPNVNYYYILNRHTQKSNSSNNKKTLIIYYEHTRHTHLMDKRQKRTRKNSNSNKINKRSLDV